MVAQTSSSRLRRFQLRNDPPFAEKLEKTVGLYLNGEVVKPSDD